MRLSVRLKNSDSPVLMNVSVAFRGPRVDAGVMQLLDRRSAPVAPRHPDHLHILLNYGWDSRAFVNGRHFPS